MKNAHKSYILRLMRLLVNRIQNIKKQIKQKELQIKKLQLHESSDVCSQICNKLILEKAILKKELKDLSTNRFISNIKKMFRSKETLICDYFKN